MITLKNKDTGEYIGTLSEEQLKYLIDELVEEHDEDQDYWINRTQIEIFKEKGADQSLINLLETALGESEDAELIWSRD